MTNIALAIKTDPRIKNNIERIVIMGGAYLSSETEYNVKRDRTAAEIVFQSGIPITAVGLDVTSQCKLREKDIDRMRLADDPAEEFPGPAHRSGRGADPRPESHPVRSPGHRGHFSTGPTWRYQPGPSDVPLSGPGADDLQAGHRIQDPGSGQGERSGLPGLVCRPRDKRIGRPEIVSGLCRALFPDQVRQDGVVFPADELDQFIVGHQTLVRSYGPRLGIRLGIVHRHFDLKSPVVGPADALRHMSFVGHRAAVFIDPRVIQEACRLHHQRVAFPPSDE